MTSTSVRPGNYNQQSRDPNTAAIMSLIVPGLGQMYNGETRKGVLFICVAVLNLILLLAMAFNLPILDGLLGFGQQFHMKPNKMLLIVLREAYLGSSVSLILMGFFLSYTFYAVRDAYDHAAMKRRRIYPDFVIELPEATSGSYIFHFSIMVALFIIAFFFIIPPMPKSQLTEIEFVDQQMRVRERVKSQRKAVNNAKAAGKHDPKKEVKPPTAAKAPKAEAKAEAKSAPAQTHAPQAPKQAHADSAAKAPAPTPSPAPPSPHMAPQPKAAPPTPHAAAPTPTPAAPSPTPTPTPTPRPMAHAPSPTAAPAAPAMPHMPAAAAPSAMAHMAPTAMAAPSAMPMAAAAPGKSMAPSAMPSMAPSALPKAGSGGGAPSPLARPNAGGGFAGLPSLAPSTIAMGSGGGSGGGTSNFAPLAKSGSGSGGGSGFGAGSIAPVNASSGGGGGGGGGKSGGGGSSGGPVPVAMGGGGGGGGSHGGSSGGGSSGGPAPMRAGGGGGQGGHGWSSGPISITPSVPKGGGGGGGGDGASGNPDKDGAGKPAVTTQADVDFGPYMADLQRRIKRAWFPPRGQENRRVKVTFKIHSGGELSNLRISGTSGFATADQAALQAVQNAAPFRPLPPGAPDSVDIEFTFDYNVFGGSGRSF